MRRNTRHRLTTAVAKISCALENKQINQKYRSNTNHVKFTKKAQLFILELDKDFKEKTNNQTCQKLQENLTRKKKMTKYLSKAKNPSMINHTLSSMNST